MNKRDRLKDKYWLEFLKSADATLAVKVGNQFENAFWIWFLNTYVRNNQSFTIDQFIGSEEEIE